MTRRELAHRLDEGTAPILVDVRSGREYAAGHVPGARHAPFWRVPSAMRAAGIAPEQPIVVYCEHGPRAWLAAAALRAGGFRHISLLEGHMAGWRRAGLPLA